MQPGYRSERCGMCLQRTYDYDQVLGYNVTEKLDRNTRDLIGRENFQKVSIETCK